MEKSKIDRTYGIEGDINAVEKLHKERRLFAVVDDIVLSAPEDSPQSHKEWINTLNISNEEKETIMAENMRGYIDLDDNVFIYKGMDFSFEESDIPKVPELVKKLYEMFQLNSNSTIFGGVIMGKAGEKWNPKLNLGSVGEIIKF